MLVARDLLEPFPVRDRIRVLLLDEALPPA